MKKILHIISSARKEGSNSTLLGNDIIEKLQARYPGSTVTTNNVSEKDYSHLTQYHLAGYCAPIETLEGVSREVVPSSDDAVAQVPEADIIVISLPIYNFNMSSALKAWIDHIVRAGKTFSYHTGKPEGMLLGKKVYLAIASHGVFTEGPTKGWDFAEPYLRFILGFLGITDITTFRIEGGGIPGIKETATQKGLESVATALA
jgi:FMN-dependent NADH-azoreductase